MNENFKEIFKRATMLGDDWLRNEFSYELTSLSRQQRESMYRQYYLNTCSAVNGLLYLKPSLSEVEALLESPIITPSCPSMRGRRGLETNITDGAMRRYLFKAAQYDQLIFDIANGRTAMIRGEDKKWLIAPDALSKLDMLGFCQRTYAVKW